jgi:(2S)-methylsuccinyl-CoA dehydrogenase
MTEVNSGMQGALQHLESADALIRKSLNWIKQQSIGGKGVSNEKLDAHQMASFDLAWCAAESTGARFAAEYAGKAAAVQTGGGSCLEERMALVFCAEALQNIHNRLRARPQSFGLNDTDIAALSTAALNQFCQTQLDAGNLEALGRQVIALNGASGAYMLSDDATMMQDSFRKLATNVVMPLAEEIHRHDRIIPKEILDPLTEMGCFGLSIPERYGGLQSDDHEDNMG